VAIAFFVESGVLVLTTLQPAFRMSLFLYRPLAS